MRVSVSKGESLTLDMFSEQHMCATHRRRSQRGTRRCRRSTAATRYSRASAGLRAAQRASWYPSGGGVEGTARRSRSCVCCLARARMTQQIGSNTSLNRGAIDTDAIMSVVSTRSGLETADTQHMARVVSVAIAMRVSQNACADSVGYQARSLHMNVHRCVWMRSSIPKRLYRS